MKKNKYLFFILLIPLFFNSFVYAQDSNNIFNFSYNYFSKENWWTDYNNRGLEKSHLGFILKNSKKVNQKWFLTFNSYKNKIILGESYFEYKVNEKIKLKVGRYYRDFSQYLNSDLTSGSMLISQNAMPMPKIGINFSYNLKRNKKYSFYGGLAHASFEENQVYKESPNLHEKFIYLNYKDNDKLFGLGFVHEAIWGGKTENYNFPSSFKDYFKVFISADGPLLPGESHPNALGNHLGIWDFYFYSFNKITTKIYYQHFFEDTSGLRFANKYDGLWGIEFLDNENNNSFLIEYLDTTHQDDDPPYVYETYYNHYQYTDGWSYKNQALGNPHINFTSMNPLKVLHLGLSNKNSNFTSKFLLSRKVNDGDNLMSFISIEKKINNIAYKLFIVNDLDISLGIKINYYLL